uniref:Uncharacterized protein n=1 Tax=Coccidioides posadasii RMSCC 3488 TaxID=454284 RepID=A0A0J6F6E0_COCPO|nr:hypothetical protein CPAG_00871 [Coccidioides posadasii RMSCC 3488]
MDPGEFMPKISRCRLSGAKQRAHQPHPTDLPLSRPYPGATLAGPSLKAAQPSSRKPTKRASSQVSSSSPPLFRQIRPSPKTRRSGQADPSPPTATLPPSTLKPCAGRHPSHHPSRHLPALVFPSSVLLPSLEQGPRCIHPDRDSCKSRWSNVTQSSKTHRTLYPSSPPLSDNLYERRRLNRPRKGSILLFIPLPLFCLSESLLHPDLAPAAFPRSDRSDRCPSQLHIGGGRLEVDVASFLIRNVLSTSTIDGPLG